MMPITPATASDRNSISGAVIYSRLIMKPPSLSESTVVIVSEVGPEPIANVRICDS
jgi:hypothetical protein